MISRILTSLTLFLAASPVMAQGSAQVPEGSQLTLFALGLIGVIVGRRLSMRRHRDQD